MFLDLIPISAQQKNMRNYLTPKEWDILRRITYKKYAYKCAICGGQGRSHPVEAHEEWAFSHDTIILIDVVALCPTCHRLKHINFYRHDLHTFRALIRRYAYQHNITEAIARTFIYNQFDMYDMQMLKQWKLDTSSIQRYYKEVTCTH
jgi:hypothetical protein